MNFIRDKYSRFSNSVLIKNIGMLVGGSALAQVVTFCATIYLTRIYLPEDFGLLSLVTSSISFLVPLATLRYDKAIILAEDENEKLSLFYLSSGINLILFLALATIAFLLWVSNTVSEIKYLTAILCVPIATLLFAQINIYQSYFEKNARFKVTSFVTIMDAVSKTILQLSLYKFFPKLGLVFGYIGALVVNSGIYIKNDFSTLFNWKKINRKDLRSVAKKHVNFPKYFTWSNIIDSASQNICSLTFPFLFSLEVLGNFMIAFKIVRLPALLIAIATRRVYYPKASELYNSDREKFFKLYKKTTMMLILASIIPVVLFVLFAESIFNLLFDPNWMSSVLFAKVILIYVFINFINSLAHENMIIFGMQRQFLIAEILWFILSAVLIYIAFLSGDAILATTFYALSGVVMELYIFIVQWRKRARLLTLKT